MGWLEVLGIAGLALTLRAASEVARPIVQRRAYNQAVAELRDLR